MKEQLQIGLFDWVEASDTRTPAETFAHKLALAAAADKAGFHAYMLAEHQGTPLSIDGSPSVMLSALFQRTRRLRAGGLTFCLPWYDPYRLYNEICMLDQMSGGRLELGVGRGVSPLETAAFGVDWDKAQAMYLEAFQVLMQALTSRSVSFAGEHYKFDESPIVLEPVQKPHPPLWYGVFNAESTAWAASLAVNVVTNLTAAAVRPITDRYRAEWAKLGKDPKRIPMMGINRHVVVAETDREAMDIGRRAYRRWFENFTALWRMRGVPLPKNIAYSEDFDGIVKNEQAIAGSPRTVRDAIARQMEQSGANYFLARLAFGDLALEAALASAELFAQRVVPELAVAPANP